MIGIDPGSSFNSIDVKSKLDNPDPNSFIKNEADMENLPKDPKPPRNKLNNLSGG